MKKYLFLLTLVFVSCTGPKINIAFEGSSPYSSSITPKEYQNSSQSVRPNAMRSIPGVLQIVGGQKSLKKHLFYPEEAIQNNIEGRVTVIYTISENGNPVNIKLLSGIGYGCDEAVLEAVKKLKYINEIERKFV